MDILGMVNRHHVLQALRPIYGERLTVVEEKQLERA